MVKFVQLMIIAIGVSCIGSVFAKKEPTGKRENADPAGTSILELTPGIIANCDSSGGKPRPLNIGVTLRVLREDTAKKSLCI
ncbi:MAG: hypothetical protein ACU84Q_10375 [Gammaproteobacteria bacterium]